MLVEPAFYRCRHSHKEKFDEANLCLSPRQTGSVFINNLILFEPALTVAEKRIIDRID